LLTALAGVGLWIYSRCKFRVVSLGASDLRLLPGLLLLASHRASGDEPIICGSLYFSSRVWAERRWHLHFTAGDQFFERGFFAGYPTRVPIWLRRLLYPINISGGMSRVGVLPLRSGKSMMLGQALAQLPADITLAEAIPPSLLVQLYDRAVALGRTPPTTANEFLRGEYADLLWQIVSREELSAPALAQLWRRRRARSRAELRALIDVLKSRQPLLIFPEGRRSRDGRIGPLRRGVEPLINEGRPDTIAYIALAYDPLTRGRTRVCAAFTAPRPRPVGNVAETALFELRRAMPVTCGQVVGHLLSTAVARGERSLNRKTVAAHVTAAVHAASRIGRPIDPALTSAKRIERRLDGCIAALVRRHAVVVDGPNLVLDAEHVRSDETIDRLALEYTSANDLTSERNRHITWPAERRPERAAGSSRRG
jgi:hypothetical protein